MSNYTNLVQDIKDFTENNGTDFANEINRFIANVELRLSKERLNFLQTGTKLSTLLRPLRAQLFQLN